MMLERLATSARSTVLITVLAACGGTSVEELCADICDCEGDNCDEAECVAETRAEEDRAAEQGCEDEFQDLVDCFSENAVCENADYEYPEEPCDAAEKALDACE